MHTHLHTPTNALDQSIDFYTRLGFKRLETGEKVVFTDGKAVIEINPDRYARAGVKLYGQNWDKVVEGLRAFTKCIETDKGYLLADPSNVWIYLVTGDAPFAYTPQEKSFSTLGNYAGLSLESIDLDRSIAIWKELGYSNVSGSAAQGWLSCTNASGEAVSLMKPLICPHLFFNPSMTYFNSGANLQVIEKIREAGVPVAEEITHFNPEGLVDNIILRDPGGFGMFIFND